jgi:hypothetical protein
MQEVDDAHDQYSDIHKIQDWFSLDPLGKGSVHALNPQPFDQWIQRID